MNEGRRPREKGGEAGSRMLYVGMLRQAAYPEGTMIPDKLIETLMQCGAEEFNKLIEILGLDLNQKFTGILKSEDFNKRATSLRAKIEQWLATTTLREGLLKDATGRN